MTDIFVSVCLVHNYTIYCKRDYFCWGKISRKILARHFTWGNFHNTTPISFIKAYGINFCVGVIFSKKTKA